MKRLVVAICLAIAPVIAHADCESKEYAEYKDEAQTKLGQMSLAYDSCRAQQSFDSAKKLGDLALRHGVLRDAERASATMNACIAQQSKIGNALRAAKANRALAFINTRCEGKYQLD